ncbi:MULTISPECIES: DapH/DapD/GlmU-related protein [unclassified Luteococcus]|uniref:DapH/DapD/GlmU-related protein n=1 Tax=unclassified Luteococcus TaxID=2639923 RepID=UPI00313C49C8
MTSSPTAPGHRRRLAQFTGMGYDKGRPAAVCAAWALVAEPLTRSVLMPPTVRASVLRAFGARIGQNVNIRNGVRIHWPWKLSVGDNSWIGVGSYLLNLEPITIGSDVCVSQQAFLCTGSHDAKDVAFEFDNAPITVEDGAWVAARATVLRGVTVGRDAVVGATALVVKDVPAGARVLAPRSEAREAQP